VKFIIGQFILHPEEDEHGAGDTDNQSEQIGN
jgi:hypothetical protein